MQYRNAMVKMLPTLATSVVAFESFFTPIPIASRWRFEHVANVAVYFLLQVLAR